jgi:hypothetical protein
MLNALPQGLANSSRIGGVAVGRDPFWRLAGNLPGLAEEALCRVYITGLAQHAIDQIALPIDRAVQIAPLAADFDLRLVDIPCPSSLPVAPGTQLLGRERRETRFPVPHCLVGEAEATLEEYLGQVA